MRQRIYIWYPVVFSLGVGFTFMNIPPLNRQFMALWGVGFDGLSWALSGLFWTHALSQVPIGLVVDRADPWALLVGGLGLCIAADLVPFLEPASLSLAVAMRFTLGLGFSLVYLSAMKLVYMLTPPAQLGFIQGLQGAGFSLGLVLPYLLLPHLGPRAWPYAYLSSAFLLSLALGTAFLMPRAELRRQREEMRRQEAARSAAEVRRGLWALLGSRALWTVSLFHGLAYGSISNLGNWLPSILADLDGRGDPLAWAGVTVLILLLATVARASSGKFLLRFSRSLMLNGSLFLTCLLYLFMGLAGEKHLVLGAALLMAVICGLPYGSVFSLAMGLVEAAYVATALALISTVANFTNVLLTLVFGYVRQYTGQFSLCLLAAGILGAVLWLAGRRVVRALDRGRP